jgi:hypothetical protein
MRFNERSGRCRWVALVPVIWSAQAQGAMLNHIPDVDWRLVRTVFGVFDARCDEVLLGVAYECGDELICCHDR